VAHVAAATMAHRRHELVPQAPLLAVTPELCEVDFLTKLDERAILLPIPVESLQLEKKDLRRVSDFLDTPFVGGVLALVAFIAVDDLAHVLAEVGFQLLVPCSWLDGDRKVSLVVELFRADVTTLFALDGRIQEQVVEGVKSSDNAFWQLRPHLVQYPIELVIGIAVAIGIVGCPAQFFEKEMYIPQ